MTSRTTILRAAAACAAVLAIAGCGGGGDDSADAPPPVEAAVAPPTPAAAAAPTDALYGSPDAPRQDDLVASLPGYDQMGSPRDAFVPIVNDDSGSSGNAPDMGAAPSGSGSPSEPQSPSSSPNPTPVAPVTPPSYQPVPGVTPNPGGVPTTPAAAPAPGPATQAPPLQGYEADFDIGGEPVVARPGDAIPPETQQFTIDKITVGAVVLKLNGGLLPDGSDTITLKEGQSITLGNQTSNVTYKLRLLEIRKV